MEDNSKINAGDHLASSGIHGLAPFFANIDIRKGGQIFVDETDGKLSHYHDGIVWNFSFFNSFFPILVFLLFYLSYSSSILLFLAHISRTLFFSLVLLFFFSHNSFFQIL